MSRQSAKVIKFYSRKHFEHRQNVYSRKEEEERRVCWGGGNVKERRDFPWAVHSIFLFFLNSSYFFKILMNEMW